MFRSLETTVKGDTVSTLELVDNETGEVINLLDFDKLENGDETYLHLFGKALRNSFPRTWLQLGRTTTIGAAGIAGTALLFGKGVGAAAYLPVVAAGGIVIGLNNLSNDPSIGTRWAMKIRGIFRPSEKKQVQDVMSQILQKISELPAEKKEIIEKEIGK